MRASRKKRCDAEVIVSDDCFSPHLDLDDAFRRSGRQIPLVWARRHANGACNLGDAASAVVVAAISGRSIAQSLYANKSLATSGI
jgi:hypothetical protein